MSKSNLARLAGSILLALALGTSAPVFAFNSGGGGGGGGDGGGGGGSNSSPTASTNAAPTMADIQAEIRANQWTRAISDLKAFLKANPRSADGWNLLGYAYRNHGDLKLADNAYDRALKLNPNHVDALSYQGVLYVKLGEIDEAKANLVRIKSICGNTSCPQYVALAKALG